MIDTGPSRGMRLLLLSAGPRTLRAGEAPRRGRTAGERIRLPAAGDRTSRRHAAHALGKIGRAAKAAIPALEKLLEDEEAGVRTTAGPALREIGK